jgi:hypothetical protein
VEERGLEVVQPRFRQKPPYPWYDAYISALFEKETDFLEDRISVAEREIVSREHQILNGMGADYTRERNAVTAALRALMALRVCNGLKRKIT